MVRKGAGGDQELCGVNSAVAIAEEEYLWRCGGRDVEVSWSIISRCCYHCYCLLMAALLQVGEQRHWCQERHGHFAPAGRTFAAWCLAVRDRKDATPVKCLS